jgi:pimeloyl-ACP methyl ester carboxylesterase
MPYCEVNDIRMYYDDAGTGSPVVLLNGATGANDTMWHALRPLLVEHLRVLHVEHRAHGRTNNPAGYLSFEQLAADLIAFIERLDIAPAHLAGFSDGGITALALGMQRPDLVRSIVAVGANYRVDEPVRAAIEQLDADVIEEHEPEFAELLAATHDPHHEPGYWREMVRQNYENLIQNPAYHESDLARVTAPTLLIAGEADPAAHLEQMLAMRRAIPSAEMLIVNHADRDVWDNHLVQDTRPEIVGPAMLEFLTRQSR